MLATCLIWLAALVVVGFSYYYFPVYAFKKSPFHRGNFTVNLLKEGLAFKQQLVEKNTSSNRDVFVYWGAFTKKAENDEFIMLFMGRKHPILPKASFKNTAELAEFRLFLMGQNHIKTKKFNGTEVWINN